MTIPRSVVDADIRALTLKQPWAQAITNYGKRVENRVWAAPAGIDWLLIHAGNGWDSNAADLLDYLGYGMPDRRSVVTGAIVAVADLVTVCSATVGTAAMCRCGNWAAAGQYHWRLGEVLVLPEPVACRGRLGLWRPDADVLAEVKRQIP